MIQTLYQIGNAIKDDPDFEQYFQPWGNPFPGQDANVIVAEVKNGEFKRLSIEKFKKTNLKKYLYRLGSTKRRATNSVPTVPYINLGSSFDKIKKSIENNGHNFISLEELKKIREALAEIEPSKDQQYLFTFKIDGKYLGDIPEMVRYFEDNAFETYYKKNYAKNESRTSDYICALSGNKTTVYGFVNSLGFTVNDNAYMRNGFDQSYSYRMFPVGQEALKTLNGIRSLVLTDKFSHPFIGKIRYLILPKFITSSNEIIREIFNQFKKKQALNLYSKKEEKNVDGFIKGTDRIIQEIIEDESLHKQDILYDILFYKDDKQFSLYLQLTDVRPSRLKRIMDYKSYIEKFYSDLTNFDDGKKHYTFHINLVAIQNFLLTEQGRKKTPHPYFFKLTEAIFYGQKVDKATFTRFLLINFRKAFKNLYAQQYGLQTAVKEGFTVYRFLEQLNIFKNLNSNNMEQTDENVKLDGLGFIEQHSNFFTSNYKKGAFLFGCLVTRLMYNQPGNAFLKELNDLSIDKGLIEKKFPKLIAKLRQYGHEFRELEQAAAKHLTDQTKVPKDEISFAVSLGLILQKEFDVRNKKIKEVETELGTKHKIVEPKK